MEVVSDEFVIHYYVLNSIIKYITDLFGEYGAVVDGRRRAARLVAHERLPLPEPRHADGVHCLRALLLLQH